MAVLPPLLFLTPPSLPQSMPLYGVEQGRESSGQRVAFGDTFFTGFRVKPGMTGLPPLLFLTPPSLPQSMPLYGVEQGRESSGQRVASGDTLLTGFRVKPGMTVFTFVLSDRYRAILK